MSNKKDSLPATAPDTAAVLGAQRGVEIRAKAAQKAVAELQAGADALVQASLGLQIEFEPELLMTPEERKKKYTGAQAEAMEMRVQSCLVMLAREVPVEDIARILRMNLRTITAIARNHAKEFATFSGQYADHLTRLAGKWLAVADLKSDEASTLQLATSAGILLTHATAIRGSLSGQSGDEAKVIPLEDPKLEEARKFLAQLKSAKPAAAPPTEEPKP
jgi:hypothetical protein